MTVWQQRTEAVLWTWLGSVTSDSLKAVATTKTLSAPLEANKSIQIQNHIWDEKNRRVYLFFWVPLCSNMEAGNLLKKEAGPVGGAYQAGFCWKGPGMLFVFVSMVTCSTDTHLFPPHQVRVGPGTSLTPPRRINKSLESVCVQTGPVGPEELISVDYLMF